MEVKVEVISRDTIKPSSPTPPNLRHYRLSFLDQIAPACFIPFFHFYPHTPTTTSFTQIHISNNLKNSLTRTLTKFYPLAGRLVNSMYVDCSDTGVPYTEARAYCQLSDFISNPSPSQFHKFLPCELGDIGDIPLAARVNFFDCGGVVLSVAISHKVADAFSSVFFVNCWAAAGRGRDCDVSSPPLGAAELFPPMEIAGFDARTGVTKDPIVSFGKDLQSKFPALKIVVIQADVGVKSACEALISETIAALGGLDIIISNAGWTQFCPFEDLEFPEEAWDKCFAVNIKAHVWLLRAALPTFKKNPEGGHLLLTGSIAGTVVGGSSMAYAVTKAGQAHLMRCLAKSQGPKVKVNSILPGLLLSEWGKLYGDQIIEAYKQAAPLKKETGMDDCADAFIMMAKNESITGSSLTVDAGLALSK